MTNREPEAQTGDLTAQCFYYKGNKKPEKGQQVEWQMSGWLRQARVESGCCPSPPLTWQPQASGPLEPELNGEREVPGPLGDRLETILKLLVILVLIALKSLLFYIP